MKTKQKQIVVNVSDESKAQINSLKELHQITDKEFIAAALVLFEAADEEDVLNTIKAITVEKEKAKILTQVAKQEALIAKLKAEIASESTDSEVEA